MSARRFTTDQVRALNDALLFLYEDVAEADPIERVVDAVGRLVPATWFSVDEFIPATGGWSHRTGRDLENIPDVQEGVREYAHQNPSAAYLASRGFAPVLCISELASFRQVSQTGFYAEVLRHLTGFRDQLAMVSRLPRSTLGFTLNRDRVFSEEERMLLEIAQPHFERILLRSNEYASLPADPPLTAREREVLHWLAEGKRDHEIAAILKAKPRTIEQHVRAILRKLAVETRAGAAATAWRARAKTVSGNT